MVKTRINEINVVLECWNCLTTAKYVLTLTDSDDNLTSPSPLVDQFSIWQKIGINWLLNLWRTWNRNECQRVSGFLNDWLPFCFAQMWTRTLGLGGKDKGSTNRWKNGGGFAWWLDSGLGGGGNMEKHILFVNWWMEGLDQKGYNKSHRRFPPFFLHMILARWLLNQAMAFANPFSN